jgi:3-methylcrotonyl-CoA carboxylase beta subunit
MPKMNTSIDKNGETFAKNAACNRDLAKTLRERVAVAGLGGPETAR